MIALFLFFLIKVLGFGTFPNFGLTLPTFLFLYVFFEVTVIPKYFLTVSFAVLSLLTLSFVYTVLLSVLCVFDSFLLVDVTVFYHALHSTQCSLVYPHFHFLGLSISVTIESSMGGPRGRVGKVAVFQRFKSFDHLTAVSGVGSSPALATCETSQVLLAGVSGGFSEYSCFAPPIAWLLSLSEIILKGTLN